MLLITLPLELLGMVVLAVVLPFIKREAVQLPKFVRWFDNYESYYLAHNASDLDGLIGPDYYLADNKIDTSTAFKLFKARYNWLAIRNPLNYFQYMYLGAEVDEKPLLLTVAPPLMLDIDAEGGSEYAQTIDGKYYEYYYIIPYKRFPGKALRLRWGHKITSRRKLSGREQFVFVISPWFTMG